ncbi:conserved phage C-terminal domain-containing protein [Clostridium gasigenes]|uniref:conserved phage C-terminal domain-containing protein n=1 Tax=Clostridium gasigenes TaxID=94869 RepID=UPI001C0B4877|nr:conserved phage C-terminal domain-containing protein [Clostridium gasigenes]MBU3107273.1 conserved phage C-terminal domain-containing protein [Clostridium gasigenes]
METTCKGIWISTEIWQKEDLTLIEKLFIVKIDSLDGEKGCYASNRYFGEFFKLSKSRCSAIIKNLKNKGYIAINYVYEDGKYEMERRIIKVKKVVDSIAKTSKEISKKITGKVVKTKEFQNDESEDNEECENEIECLELSGTRRKRPIIENIVDLDLDLDEMKDEFTKLEVDNVEEEIIKLAINEIEEEVIQLDIFGEKTNAKNIKSSSSSNNNNKSKANKSENNRNEDKKNIKKEMYQEIIGYLNIKCNKNYKYTTGKTQRCINARIREGHTLDDFQEVIDKKYDEWSKNSMKVYLRPETLFGSKFERYLTEDAQERKNHFKESNWIGVQAYGKQFKNVRNSGENKETKERTRFGNITPLTAEEIEWAERELF